MKPTGYVIAAIIAVILAIASFTLGIVYHQNKYLMRGLLAFWAVVPPVYFFFEFHYIRAKHPGELQKVKESQDQAVRIWAGVATALGFFLLEK